MGTACYVCIGLHYAGFASRPEHKISSWSTCSRTKSVFFPHVRIQVSHSHKIAGRITILHVFDSYILSSKRKDTVFWSEWMLANVPWINCCCVVNLCALFCCFENELRPSFVATFQLVGPFLNSSRNSQQHDKRHALSQVTVHDPSSYPET